MQLQHAHAHNGITKKTETNYSSRNGLLSGALVQQLDLRAKHPGYEGLPIAKERNVDCLRPFDESNHLPRSMDRVRYLTRIEQDGEERERERCQEEGGGA